MEVLIIGIALLAVPGLLYALYQTYLLMGALTVPGVGRIFFLSMASQQFWTMLVLLFFLINSVYPGWAGDSAFLRLSIRLFFGVYLVAQTAGVNIALYHWRNPRLP